jgi:dephospho-CoA kinase
MMANRGYTREEAEARIAAQMSVAEKAEKSHYVIHNDAAASDLREETLKFADWLKEKEQH